jgi:hypothetical protein
MWRHLFTSKHFRYGALLMGIGAIGMAVFGVYRIFAFSYYGPVTLPYTTPIDDISGLLFLLGLPVAEGIALYQWWRGGSRVKTEDLQIVPVKEAAPVVATLAKADITSVAMPIAIPATNDLIFMDAEGVLKFGDATVELPALKSEHLLCRAMFKHPVNKLVDWTIPYEEMTGEELNKVSHPDEYWKAWHSLYDTTKALNARVKQGLGIELFVKWKDNTLKRTR